jgi:adenylate cyclase
MAIFSLSKLTSIPGKLREMRLQELELAANNQYLQDALIKNKREGQKLAIYARWIALAVIAVLLPIINFTPSVLYYEALLLVFGLLGWAQLRVAQVGQSRGELFLMICDVALMTFIVLIPNPFYDQGWPVAMQFRFGSFQYFFVLLAGATLAYTWRTLFAFTTWTTLLWLIGLLGATFFGR